MIYSPFRPGHNQFDFDNLIAVIDLWMPFLQRKLGEVEFERSAADIPDDDYPAEFFVAPWGSGLNQQGLATGRPAERTRNVLATRAARQRKDNGPV